MLWLPPSKHDERGLNSGVPAPDVVFHAKIMQDWSALCLSCLWALMEGCVCVCVLEDMLDARK